MSSGMGGVVTDGATRTCPQCRRTLVFTGRHPILTVGVTLERSGVERGDRIRYERAWVWRERRL